MTLTDNQTKPLHELIEMGRQKEYIAFNRSIENAVEEWKNGEKSNKEAYNKIYKKVIKNEHFLVNRYANLTDDKLLLTIAELYADDILNMSDLAALDDDIKEEVLRITRL